MNASDKREPKNNLPQVDGVVSNINHSAKPADVPVFRCIVYVSRDPDGGVRARVANLSGLQCSAASEREALQKIVPAFKQRVAELTEQDTPIPWIDPPSPAEPDEQHRFIPVHL